jgi:glycosyltransferase involved in cell wall biosynthesis
MMIRNEAENLPRCLGSVNRLDIFDEIIVVDTGSTDDSVEIARAHGANVFLPTNLHEYFVKTEFGSKLNFGKTRTLTAQLATGDWIFSLDADEELAGAPDRFRNFLETVKENAVGLMLEDIQHGEVFMRFVPARCFRRGITWDYIVHNYPVMDGPAAFFPDIKILHYGYELSPEKAQEKTERTLGLLKRRLKDNPQDYKTHQYLAQIYCDEGPYKDIDKAVESLETYIAHKPEIDRFNDSVYFLLIQALIAKGDMENADKYLGLALRDLPGDVDIADVAITYGILIKNAGVTYQASKRFILNYDAFMRDPALSMGRYVYMAKPDRMARALYNYTLMTLTEGFQCYRRLMAQLKECPYPVREQYLGYLDQELQALGLNLQIRNGKKKKNRRGDKHGFQPGKIERNQPEAPRTLN